MTITSPQRDKSMRTIIQQATTNDNYFLNQKAVCARNLPKLHQKVLYVFFEDRLAGLQYSDRSCKELAARFKVSEDHMYRVLAHLHHEGCLDGLPHGRGFKKRWITFEAFAELESKLPDQMPVQNLAIPYIDLLSDKDDLNTKSEEACTEIDQTLLLDRLNLILEQIWHHPNDRIVVKEAINRSPLSPISKLSLVRRVGRGMITNPVKYKRAYFMTSLKNEEMRF